MEVLNDGSAASNQFTNHANLTMKKRVGGDPTPNFN
jgi:hypothetical protein